MLTSLLDLDASLFYLINQVWRADWVDFLMPYWRSKYLWGPLYLFLLFFLVLNFGKRGWLVVLALILAAGLADITSSHLLKKSIKRVRPCKNPEVRDHTVLLVRCGSGFSFPSSHATNHFALSTMLILTLGPLFRWVKWPLIFWAASIAYGQVYVGVHYPSDVLFGALLGMTISWLLFKGLSRYTPRWLDIPFGLTPK